MSDKKKKITATAAVITAAALLLGGTFAWQSISQVALNEKEETINPGGRLHDDFDGSNKDVYVENFADNPIFARVRLDEYFEFISNKGTDFAETHIVTEGAVKGDTSTYHPHFFDGDNLTDNYWNWTTGGSTVYMPTFNKNKDSLDADINGTFAENYEDYVEYEYGDEVTDEAVYDNDANSDEDENVVIKEETHYATVTDYDGFLISMQEWIAEGSEAGPYWVYDTDGWVYWAQAIDPGTATGLLLDSIAPAEKFDDSYYYAINVVAQFVTADDVGKDDGTGFYDRTVGTAPTKKAEAFLKAIGVDMGEEPATEEPTETKPVEPVPDTVATISLVDASGADIEPSHLLYHDKTYTCSAVDENGDTYVLFDRETTYEGYDFEALMWYNNGEMVNDSAPPQDYTFTLRGWGNHSNRPVRTFELKYVAINDFDEMVITATSDIYYTFDEDTHTYLKEEEHNGDTYYLFEDNVNNQICVIKVGGIVTNFTATGATTVEDIDWDNIDNWNDCYYTDDK